MRGFLLQLWAVLQTEARLHFRDRRALGSALLMPVLGPILFAGMFSAFASWASTEKPLVLPVAGGERAPMLVAFLERYGARVEPAPADAQEQVREGRLDVVLVIPEGYAEDFGRGRPARVEVWVDNSRNRSRTPYRRVRALLEAYSQGIGAQRLLARGVASDLARPLQVEEVDLSTPEKLAATLLHTIPIFLIVAAFAGGMSVAIDTTAGERERGSLEPLLLNPVDRRALVAGKWLAAASVAWLAVALTALGFALAARQVPLEDLGVKLRLGPQEVGLLLAVVLPLALLATALEMVVATFARSFKEAQTYLTALMLLPMVPSMVLTFRPVQEAPWMWAVPALGQDLLVGAVMRGEGLPWGGWLLSLLGVAAGVGACLTVAVGLLSRERIVFGR